MINPPGDSGSIAELETDKTTTQEDGQVSDYSLHKAGDWEGDPRYYQSGKKMGTLKPSASATVKKQTEFAGLNFDDLKPTQTIDDNNAPEKVDPKSEKAKLKAERKSSDARVGAKIAMRILNVIVRYISGGEYGKDFTPQQVKERNAYAEELENDWREYLLTLDVPLHPALIVAFGSVTYVADAFSTEKGKEKAASIKEKIFGKVGMMMFGGKK